MRRCDTGFYDLTVIPFLLSSYQCEFVQESALKQLSPGQNGLVGFLVASGTHVFAIREFKGEFYKIDVKDRVRKFHDLISLQKYLTEHLKSKNAIMSIVSKEKEPSIYLNDLAGLSFMPPSYPPPPVAPAVVNPFDNNSLMFGSKADEKEPNPFDQFDKKPEKKKIGLEGLNELFKDMYEEQKKEYNLPSAKPQTKKPIMRRAP